MKRIVTIFFILYAFISFGQEKLAEFEPKIKVFNETRKYDASTNMDSTQFSLFIRGAKEINAILLNDTFGIEKNLVFSEPYISNSTYIGYVFNNNEHTFYYIKKGKLMHLTLDFLNETISNGEIIEVKTKDGYKNVKYLSADGKFYIIRAKENCGVLVIYEFSGEKKYNQYKFAIKPEFSNLLVHNEFRVPPNLFDPISCAPGFANDFLWNIYRKINALKCNVSYHERTFYICIDEPSSNNILMLDLDKKEGAYKYFEVGKKSYTTADIYKNILFQLTTMEDSLKINITNLQDNEIIKEYSVSSSDSVSFKNTPLFKNYKSINITKKEYSSTKEFLSRVDNSTPFISVLGINDTVRMVMGSLKCSVSAIEILMSNPNTGGVATGSGNLILSTYFECLLDDKTFEHLEGDVPPWIFEQTRSYKKEIGDIFGYNSEITIELGDYNIYGFFNKKTRKYELIKLYR